MNNMMSYKPRLRKRLITSTCISTLCIVAFMICIVYVRISVPNDFSYPAWSMKPYVIMVALFMIILVISNNSTWFVFRNSSDYMTLYKKALELDKIANTDPLTGLFNKRALTNYINENLTPERSDSVFSLIICDIDNFKKVNDTYGHSFGDEILKKVADTVKNQLRTDDFLCRWGGEEFVIILNKTEKSDAKVIAERIRECVAAESVNNGANDISVTITLGVADSLEAKSYDEIINLSDERLYEGKTNGKNVVVI